MRAIACIALAAFLASPAANARDCLTQHELVSLSTSSFRLPAGASTSRLEITGRLLRRPLLATDEFSWVGFELADVSLALNGQRAASRVYSVPFAVKLERGSRRALKMVYNAPLRPEDREKLRAIYLSLRVAPPPTDAEGRDYLREEVDSLGRYRVQYRGGDDGALTRSRLEYTELRSGSPAASALRLDTVEIDEDRFVFQPGTCWHERVDGRSDLTLTGGQENMSIRVVQSLELHAIAGPLPASARLPGLPLDPESWEPIPLAEIYPPPPRRPLPDAAAFLAELAALENADAAALRQLLYDNEKYLGSLDELLREGALADAFERRLFLAVGKTDTASAHALLAGLAVDTAASPQARFRSLMALKYAEQPLAATEVDRLFDYARSSGLEGPDAEIAHSAVMVLGIVAHNQAGTGFGDRLSGRIDEELAVAAGDEQAAALLLAAGNTRNPALTEGVANYLEDDNPVLRERAARALGGLPSQDAETALLQQLVREPQTQVRAAALRALGRRSLGEEAVERVLEEAAPRQPREIRAAAIEALAAQAGRNPELRPELKRLARQETDKRNLETLLDAIY